MEGSSDFLQRASDFDLAHDLDKLANTLETEGCGLSADKIKRAAYRLRNYHRPKDFRPPCLDEVDAFVDCNDTENTGESVEDLISDKVGETILVEGWQKVMEPHIFEQVYDEENDEYVDRWYMLEQLPGESIWQAFNRFLRERSTSNGL